MYGKPNLKKHARKELIKIANIIMKVQFYIFGRQLDPF